MIDLGHWSVTARAGTMPAGVAGFIYEIENRVTGKKYIGKKVTVFKRSKKVEGRIRRVHSTTDSDWRTYMGSCKPLTTDIKELGKENFTFTILEWCMSRKELRFSEVATIWENKCLLLPDLWYNESSDSLRFSIPKYHKDSSRSKW